MAVKNILFSWFFSPFSLIFTFYPLLWQFIQLPFLSFLSLPLAFNYTSTILGSLCNLARSSIWFPAVPVRGYAMMKEKHQKQLSYLRTHCLGFCKLLEGMLYFLVLFTFSSSPPLLLVLIFQMCTFNERVNTEANRSSGFVSFRTCICCP